MTKTNFQRRKRTAKQTISISPALKDWIERLVRKKHNKSPDDERYQSISAFYNFILENALVLLKSGKTLEELSENVDKKEENLLNRLSFDGIISLHDQWLKMNRYRGINIRKMLPVLFMIKKNLTSGKNVYNLSDVEEIFENCIQLTISDNNTKNLHFYLKKSRRLEEIRLSCEHVGDNRNLQYENLKFFGILLGFLGIELVDFFYTEKDLFAQLEFQTTELFFSSGVSRKKRIELIKKNLTFFQDYFQLLEDNDFFFWMEVAEIDSSYLKFSNIKVLQNWIQKIEQDLNVLESKNDLPVYVIKFFEKINWIEVIENRKDEYRLKLDRNQDKEQLDIFREVISDYTNIIEQNNKIVVKIQ